MAWTNTLIDNENCDSLSMACGMNMLWLRLDSDDVCSCVCISDSLVVLVCVCFEQLCCFKYKPRI